jgi:RNA polymerase sigma factor (TIGR02999 family)
MWAKAMNLDSPWDQSDRAIQAFVYERLHALAHGQLKAGMRFAQTTSLVHEAYLRMSPNRAPERAKASLAKHDSTPQCEIDANHSSVDRSHFFAIAATVMRQILVDRARATHAMKRGAGAILSPLSMAHDGINSDDPAALLQIDAALECVRQVDARLATLVELKVFGGLDVPELTDALDISERSVKRYWRQARALLIAEFT